MAGGNPSLLALIFLAQRPPEGIVGMLGGSRRLEKGRN